MLSAHTITVVDSLDLIPASVESEIVRTASYGMNLISRHVEWKGTLNTEVRIRPASENPNSAADGLMQSIVSATWTGSAWRNDTLNEMISGVDRKPTEADVGMTVYLGNDGQIRTYGFLAWFDPQPSYYAPPSVPTGSFDFIGVFVHEVFHGIGFVWWTQEFQSRTSSSDGVDYFIGPHTQQVYGGPLPLAPRSGELRNDHYGNTSLAENRLQSGLMFQWGNYEYNRLDIGRLDLAVLKDLGLTIKSTVGLPLVDVLDSQRPTAVISSNAVSEGVGSGTTVATLTTRSGPSTTGGGFSLVAGFGNNSAFRISENRLLTHSVLDYEQKPTHSLLIRFSDNNGVFTDTPLTVSVSDVAEAAPLNLVGTPGNGQVRLTWAAPSSTGGSPITDYVVQYRETSSSAWITFPDGTSTSTSATVTRLTNGTPYLFRVARVNGAGTSDFSTPTSSITPRTVPTAPINLVGTPGNGQVRLTWAAPSSNGGSPITGYVVQYRETSSSAWITFPDGTSASTSTTVTGLTNGRSYVFRLAAVNSVGSSRFSTPSAPAMPITAPSEPRNLVGTPGDRQGTLTWSAPINNRTNGATTYEVQYSSDNGASWTTFPSRPSPRTTTIVTGLANGTSYVFRVAAMNALGKSTYSANSSPVVPASPPAAPTNLTVTPGNTKAILQWTAPPNGGRPITNYAIQYSRNNGGSWTTFGRTASTANNATVTGLANGTGYVFRVAAINGMGRGAFTQKTNVVKPAITVPGAPGSLAIAHVSPTGWKLTWTAPDSGGSPITGYTIRTSTDGGLSWSTVVANQRIPAVNGNIEWSLGSLARGDRKFGVSASNAVGNGDWGVQDLSWDSGGPEITVPGAPGSLAIVFVPYTGWKLTWTAPDSGGSPITGYTIRTSSNGGLSWSTVVANQWIPAVNGNVEWSLGYLGGGDWKVGVSAINAVGNGDWRIQTFSSWGGPGGGPDDGP